MTMSAQQPIRLGPVTARPRLTARIGYLGGIVILVVFVVVALLMKRDNAGAHFVSSDRIATVLIGIVLAGLCLMPSRPRLHADADAVRLRSFLGGWRVIPWSVIVRVEFPSKVRFARLVLPGGETLAIYAVQRWDRAHAVHAMRALRELAAAVGATDPGPR